MAKAQSEATGPEREKPEGGKTPHAGDHHQDKWPANPEPSESAQAKAEANDAKEKELHG